MNITLGKYQSYNTIFHRMDSRVKLVGMIIFMVASFLNYGATKAYGAYSNLMVYLFIFLILFVFSILSKTSFLQLFHSLKALWVMILFLLVLQIFLPGSNVSGDVAFQIFNRNVYYATIVNLSYILIRLILVMMMTNIFTSTTKPMDMTAAMEWLFYPLKLIKVPIHKLAMALSLALRFIPTLIEQTNKIMKAQASRGVDYRQGKFKDKVRAIIALIIPLFMQAFITSGELADAMEARGYDPDAKRTRYRVVKWQIKDTVSVILLASFLGGMIALSVLRFDYTLLFPNWKLPALSSLS